MTRRFFTAIIILLTVFVFLGQASYVEAARFGGGRSFGGSPGFNRPFKSQSLPRSAQNGITNPGTSQRQQPGAMAASGVRPGLFGGIFGGILAGTLLGSLLSGHGFAGGGLLDILIIGLIGYFIFRLFTRRRASSMQQGRTSPSVFNMPMPGNESSGFMRENNTAQNNTCSLWNALGANDTGMNNANISSDSVKAGQDTAKIPPDFDQEEFLRGAKILYSRMNESWDQRDLDDIAEFSTTPFMEEIRRQAKENPGPETTRIILVNARLLSVISEAGRESATVYFDVTLQEHGASAPEEIREVWHFVRAANSRDMWKLDGIQQVED